MTYRLENMVEKCSGIGTETIHDVSKQYSNVKENITVINYIIISPTFYRSVQKQKKQPKNLYQPKNMFYQERPNDLLVFSSTDNLDTHLLRHPPQILITVSTVWIQVHAEGSGQNKDFLFNKQEIKYIQD